MGTVAKEDILPTNYDVLQRELPILDIMTRNRERRVWQIARGETVDPAAPIDDSETPPFVDAKTNLTKTQPFIPAAETVAKMTIGQGLQVNVFASEEQFPELVNPVQMSFDTKGRLWVAVWQNYPQWQPKTPMDDKLLILEDTNGDGRADKRTVFAGDLANPTGFEFWNGGVIVADQPNLIFLRTRTATTGTIRARSCCTASIRPIRTTRSTASCSTRAARCTSRKGPSIRRRSKRRGRRCCDSTAACTASSRRRGIDNYVPMNFRIRTATCSMVGPRHYLRRHGRATVLGPSFSTRSTTRRWRPRSHPGRSPFHAARRRREFLISRNFPETFPGNMMCCNVIRFLGLHKLSDRRRLGHHSDGIRADLAIKRREFPADRPGDRPRRRAVLRDWHNPIIGHMQHNLRDPTAIGPTAASSASL